MQAWIFMLSFLKSGIMYWNIHRYKVFHTAVLRPLLPQAIVLICQSSVGRNSNQRFVLILLASQKHWSNFYPIFKIKLYSVDVSLLKTLSALNLMTRTSWITCPFCFILDLKDLIQVCANQILPTDCALLKGCSWFIYLLYH